MCVRVLVADDTDIIRRGIKQLLKDRDDIAVIGEASNLPETIQKTAEFLPDVVIMDLRMTASANGELNSLTIGRPTVAISFAIDEIAKEQAERLGAVKFIDKMELAKELVPTLLQFAPKEVRESARRMVGVAAIETLQNKTPRRESDA
jgi:DNA-binding NarL/FixJ family response regulator